MLRREDAQKLLQAEQTSDWQVRCLAAIAQDVTSELRPIAYALLSLAEAVALRVAGSSGPSIASGLAWLTLPVLAWFVALTVFAVQDVYDIPALNALAFALLPIAVLTTALVLVLFGLGALHAARVL